MDPVARFAAEATRFRDWMRHGGERDEWAVRGALIRVTHLYLAALELPPFPHDAVLERPDAKRVDISDWRPAVFGTARRLPFEMYGQVFDSATLPPEEPVVGCMSDDLGDIYRDVVTGLQEYEAGRRINAYWEWGFSFQNHWGAHATSAIRALHSWLACNAPNGLSAQVAGHDYPDG